MTRTNAHSSSDSTLIPSYVTRFGRRSGSSRFRGQCLQHATAKEERPRVHYRLEAIAAPAATESDRGSRVLGICTRMACISSTPGAVRSGPRCNGSRAFIPDADKPDLHSAARGEGEVNPRRRCDERAAIKRGARYGVSNDHSPLLLSPGGRNPRATSASVTPSPA